jgi:hypothetical protein
MIVMAIKKISLVFIAYFCTVVRPAVSKTHTRIGDRLTADLRDTSILA